MLLKPDQSFFIGRLYGSSENNDKIIEIFYKNEIIKSFWLDFFEKYSIEFDIEKDDFREIIIFLQEELKNFLNIFDLDHELFLGKNIRPDFEILKNGDLDVVSSFIIGLFESSGFDKKKNNMVIEIKMIVPKMDKKLLDFILSYVKKNFCKDDEEIFEIIDKNISGYEYFIINLQPKIMKKILDSSSLNYISKLY